MRYGLLVGINKYKEPGSDLSGCVNDVIDMHDYLTVHGGFDKRKVKVLTNHNATQGAMIQGLNWLMEAGQKDAGAELLFHYSGHGSQVKSKVGDDETDGLTEILCPYDIDDHWDDPLSDDVLKDIFKAKPKTANLTVILDSCFSGGMSRMSKNHEKSRYRQAPGVEIPHQHKIPTNRIGLKQAPDGNESMSMNHILMSACRENQTAADAYIEGKYNGAFTYGIIKALGCVLTPTVRDLFYAATLVIKSDYEQRPCLCGKTSLKNRLFLGDPATA